MALNTVHDLFEQKLQVVLASEKRNLDMLEEAASEAQEPKLREAFERHHEETRQQVRRVEDVFAMLQKRPRNVDASVVEGLFEEKRRFLHEDPSPQVLDLFNLTASVKAEHIEIAAYEELLLLAGQMGEEDVVDPLRENLEEERATLEALMRLAKEGGVPMPEKAQEQEQEREMQNSA